MPLEIHSPSRDEQELQTARAYIKECEEREEALRTENQGLKKDLRKAQEALEDLPSDHKALITDHKQEKTRAEFYERLMKDAEERAKTYSRRLEDAVNKQRAAENDARRAADLQKQNQEHQAQIHSLIEENRCVRNAVSASDSNHAALLAEKDARIELLEDAIVALQFRYDVLQAENDTLDHEYTGIIERLESLSAETADNVLYLAAETTRVETLANAHISELWPLQHFASHANLILAGLRSIMQDLLADDPNRVVKVPPCLEENLQEAHRDIEKYVVVHRMIDGDVAEDEMRDRIKDLARVNIQALGNLQGMHDDVKDFLASLNEAPELWDAIRMKLKKLRKS